MKKSKRLELAKQFVKGAAYGTIQNLKRYKDQTQDELQKAEAYFEEIDKQSTIAQLMGIEGNIKEIYYAAFPKIITQDIEFTKRVKNPPDNMMNALVSFVNSMIYTEVLREIYKTQLNPTISYLHEPGYRRFLCLWISLKYSSRSMATALSLRFSTIMSCNRSISIKT